MDDAAVYRIADDRLILSTIDFFPPMVEDARSFGRIAAANALSDVYAMGGRPLYALNIVCFPQSLDLCFLSEIISGGIEKCAEAGALVAGGHSIYDKEVKYGLAVTGVIDNGILYRNNTPRIGDALILTKPLGIGIITAAGRGGEASSEDMAEAIQSMERLNKYAAEKLAAFDVSACTDVTGFGLAVHALEMAAGVVTIEINSGSIPYLKNIKRYIDDDYPTGGGARNRAYAGSKLDVSGLPAWVQELVFDPQTSGGLLITADAGQAADLLHAIRRDDPAAAMIGRVIERQACEVVFI